MMFFFQDMYVPESLQQSPAGCHQDQNGGDMQRSDRNQQQNCGDMQRSDRNQQENCGDSNNGQNVDCWMCSGEYSS